MLLRLQWYNKTRDIAAKYILYCTLPRDSYVQYLRTSTLRAGLLLFRSGARVHMCGTTNQVVLCISRSDPQSQFIASNIPYLARQVQHEIDRRANRDSGVG